VAPRTGRASSEHLIILARIGSLSNTICAYIALYA
jgi:hypothetical protein